MIYKGHLEFHCLIVDFQRFDHGLREDGGKGESLKRMYYQLILHRLCRYYGADHFCYALVDKANELTGLDDMKKGLNSECQKRYNHSGHQLRQIEFRDSKTEPMLQLNDLVLGAVCYQKNRRNEEQGIGQFKSNLAGYVLGKSGLVDFDADTSRGDPFQIWNLRSNHFKGR